MNRMCFALCCFCLFPRVTESAPFSLCVPDLTDPAEIRPPSGGAIVWIADGRANLPIVADMKNRDVRRAAVFLRDVVFEMTGVRPEIVKESVGPAVRLATPRPKEGAFTVRTADGSLWLEGNGPFAAYDFAERVLDVRQYYDPADGGRCVNKVKGIVIPPLDYSDRPVYSMRRLHPFPGDKCAWMAVWKAGDELCRPHKVHEPRTWFKDTNFNYRVTRPEIFERTPDGQRAASPMLCYSNPKTIETYVERIDEELAGGRKAGGILCPNEKTISVSQWDTGLCCTCDDCLRLRTDELGPEGTYSPVIWSRFTPQLSDIAAKRWPGYTLSILPYHNTCTAPRGIVYTNGNVMAWLVTHPGVALLKDKNLKREEEEKIRTWAKVTGQKVVNWHYLCYPQRFTPVPILFGQAIVDHYRDMQDFMYGSFVDNYSKGCGEELSAYVWLRALWNPAIDPEKVYDGFAARLYGVAARPMREFIRIQATGWMRPWPQPRCSNKNIYERSYPRVDVLRMADLASKARTLAKDDPLVAKRVEDYLKPFAGFFRESEEYASGGAFAPVEMVKAFALPTVDGRLDEECWTKARPSRMVEGIDRSLAKPSEETEVRVVWSAGEGVCFGVRCHEKSMAKANRTMPPLTKNEMLEIFFDPSGQAEGSYFQIALDLSGARKGYLNSSSRWDMPGVKTAVYEGLDFWSAEVFVPFSAIRDFAGVQIPTTAAGSCFWIGNISRIRVGARENEKIPWEIHRLFTRFSKWNKDQSAFGKFVFKEW